MAQFVTIYVFCGIIFLFLSVFGETLLNERGVILEYLERINDKKREEDWKSIPKFFLFLFVAWPLMALTWVFILARKKTFFLLSVEEKRKEEERIEFIVRKIRERPEGESIKDIMSRLKVSEGELDRLPLSCISQKIQTNSGATLFVQCEDGSYYFPSSLVIPNDDRK